MFGDSKLYLIDYDSVTEVPKVTPDNEEQVATKMIDEIIKLNTIFVELWAD
jgi:hypothetical protein